MGNVKNVYVVVVVLYVEVCEQWKFPVVIT